MIATIISRVYDPFLMLAIVFFVRLWGKPEFVPAITGMVLFPFLLYLFAWKIKLISNWDMNNRSERPRILWTLVVVEIICFLRFQLWSMLPILLAMIGFTVITQFWKMSGHAMSAALATGSIVLRFGWNYWPVLLIVPLVSWSRVVRKNHTIAQVIAGALYSWFLLYFL